MAKLGKKYTFSIYLDNTYILLAGFISFNLSLTLLSFLILFNEISSSSLMTFSSPINLDASFLGLFCSFSSFFLSLNPKQNLKPPAIYFYLPYTKSILFYPNFPITYQHNFVGVMLATTF